ncbi:MAG: heme A synthase [Flavobacteriales bacterium]|nr:heme A synthase [Flavobacteriales bacterium]
MKKDTPILLWLLSGCLLIFIMVVVGGITRLTHSGLSMVEWHLFMGSIPPLNQADWIDTFTKYKEFPEFQELNYDFKLDDFKSIFWWEYIHRMIGRLLGFVFIIPFSYFLVKRKLSKRLIKQSVVMFFMGGFQGFLGWFMVKSGLVSDPHVSHFRLAIHLTFAFLIFGYIFWVMLGIFFKEEITLADYPVIRKLGWVLFPVVVIQIVYGAFVAGLRAGTLYNTFPKMGSEWIAEGVTAISPFYENFIYGLAGVQFVHRYIAYVVAGLIIAIWWQSIKQPIQYSQQLASRGLLYVMVLQFTLGVLTLLYSVPVLLGVLHQSGAFLLLAANLFLLHRFRRVN